MADHKDTCPKKTDKAAACNCGAETPPATTRKCYDCDAEIGANEKICPKCKANLEDTDQEDGVIEKALARLKKKRKTPPTPPTPDPPPPAKKKSVFSSLNRFNK